MPFAQGYFVFEKRYHQQYWNDTLTLNSEISNDILTLRSCTFQVFSGARNSTRDIHILFWLNFNHDNFSFGTYIFASNANKNV